MSRIWLLLVVAAIMFGPGACALLPAFGLSAAVGSIPASALCSTSQIDESQPPTTHEARTAIPPTYLTLYQRAARAEGIPWPVLAAIGRVESNHGADPSTSDKGARGPMQFLPTTWHDYGVDGNHDGRTDITDPRDAIPAAAMLLKASGALTRLRDAIFAYNHSQSYVDQVLDYAHRYGGKGAPQQPSAALDEIDGQCAASNSVEPPNANSSRIIAFARAQLGKPYIWGATGPDAFDCSGLTLRAYQAAGITIPRTTYEQFRDGPRIPVGTEQPGDLIFFDYEPGMNGPGHVGIVSDPLRGLMLVAPHTGDVVKTQSYRTYPGGIVGITRPR